MVFVLMTLSIIGTSVSTTFACTQIVASFEDRVLFGNNEDAGWSHPLGLNPGEGVLFFYPASTERFPGKYGCVFVGWLWKGTGISLQGGMNDQGLCYDMTACSEVEMNIHPEKPNNFGVGDYFFAKILRECANVQEAIELFDSYNFEGLWMQFHLADASGESVIIGPGSDGELVFTRKPSGEGYLVSTAGYNPSFPDSYKGSARRRYDTAVSMLDGIDEVDDLSVSLFSSVLDAVHQSGDIYTVYSNIFDPRKGRIYLCFLSQFDKVVELDLEEELSKGEHLVHLKDLFSRATVNRALLWYWVVTGGIMMLSVGGILVFLCGGYLSVRYFLRRRNSPRPRTRLRLQAS